MSEQNDAMSAPADEAMKRAIKAAYDAVDHATHVAHISPLEADGVANVDGDVDFAAVVNAVLASLESSGWVCVPREATQAENEAMDRVPLHPGAGYWNRVRDAMLAAAPRIAGEKR